MLNTFHFEHLTKSFRYFNIYCTNKYRLTYFVSLFNIFYNSSELRIFCLINNIWKVFSLNRSVSWNTNNVHTVDWTEFLFFCLSSTSHTTFLSVFIEEVLERNCSKSLTFSLYFNMFLSFNSLMKTIWISSTWHHTTCKCINNNDFAIFYNIILIKCHSIVCL